MSGGGTGTSKDQLNLQNKLQQQQLDQQKAIRDQIMGSVGKYLSGSGEGFDPAQLAAMTSQFLNQNTANFGQARQQVLAGLNARGGGGGAIPAGGDLVRSLSALEGAQASSQSQGTLGLGIENLQQALTNRFNAAQVASGQGAQLGQNVGVFGSGASNALNQYVQASQSGFMNQLGKNLGASLGQGIGAVATGGIGASLGGISNMISPATRSASSYPATPGYP